MADYTPNSGTQFLTNDAGSQRMLYQAGIETFEQSTDFWKPFESMSMSSPIWCKKDTSKLNGSQMTFTVRSGLYGEATLGDTALTSASYEEMDTGSYTLTVDYLRHQTSITPRADELMGLGGELERGIPQLLGQWLGREKTDRMWMMYKHEGGDLNTVYAGTATSADTLASTDTFSYDTVLNAGYQLRTMNGRPASVGRDADGNEIKKYCVVGTTEALYSLKGDTDYQRNIRDAGKRGRESYIFKGGYESVDGNIIKEYNPISHDGKGPIGSAVNPRAELGVALPAAAAASEVKGGGYAAAATKTSAKYFRFFPGYDYPLTATTTTSTPAGDYYIAIVNPSNAATDPGKFGFYSFTEADNDGTTITIDTALTGVVTTLGGLTWDASVNTNNHPEGAQIVLVNEDAVPYGWSIVMGSGAALRGYGSEKHKVTRDLQDGGMVRQVYIRSVFGQCVRQDLRGRAPGYLLVCHALDIPGISINPNLTP